MDEAVARINAAREAGADASFIEAPGSVEQLAEIGRRVPAPRVANMIEGGRTPVLSRQELVDLGFQLIVYPLSGLYAAAQAMTEVFEELRREGTTMGSRQAIMRFERFNELIGVDAKYAMAQRYGA